MKASLRFREDQKPLFRAKVPMNFLGFPFQYGVSAGESKEFSLNLNTFFRSGPSVKLVCRPNDSSNPFGLVFKAGTGSFGSPIAAPVAIAAEFNLLDRGKPGFFLRFRPEFGDFSIKKSVRSPIVLQPQTNGTIHRIGLPESDLDSAGEASFDHGGDSCHQREESGFQKLNRLSIGSGAGDTVDGLLTGVEVSARTVLPIRHRHVLKFRWGVRLPAERDSLIIKNRTAEMFFRKMPFLKMSKISIENVADESKSNTMFDRSKMLAVYTNVADYDLPITKETAQVSDVADACLAVKSQLDSLHYENGSLRKAVEELRSEIAVGSQISD